LATPDVFIVGGGIIGCSIAWRLAQRGCRVVVADAGRLCGQASWAGAGMLAPGGEVERDSLWARRSAESLAMYPAFISELEDESGERIDYRACGALELAYAEHEQADLERKAASQAALGIRSSVIDPVGVRELAPALATEGLLHARHYPDDAVVDPREMARALERALRKRGVEIRENSPVAQLPGGVVVVSAGAWSNSAGLSGAPQAYPVKGHLIGYDLAPGTLQPILRHGHTYVLQRGSGFTIAGSTTERMGFDASVDPAIVARLHERARRYLPGLLRASPDASWAGLRPAVEGDEPQVGRWRDTSVWLAYGHYRNGILLAPITAALVASEITST
jgi:glycine oxidase